MRRLAAPLLAGLALVLVATAGATPSDRIACGIKSLDFYFWPKGHAAVPQLGFPDFPAPHLEVYTGAPPGKLGHQLAYLSATDFKLVQGCPPKGETATRWSGGPRRTLRRATSKLHCVYPKRVELAVSSGPGGVELAVTLGHTPGSVTAAAFGPAGARLDYDARYCAVVSGT